MKKKEALFRSLELDQWARLKCIVVNTISAFIMGPEGYICSIHTAYPLTKTLRIEGSKPNEDAIEVKLSEIWFAEKKTFAVYDCTQRSPSTYKLTYH